MGTAVGNVLGREEAAERLGGIEHLEISDGPAGQPIALRVAVPPGTKQPYPLLLVLDPGDTFGSAVELARLMGQTGEIRQCLVVGIPIAPDMTASDAQVVSFITRKVLPLCRERHGVGPVILFDAARGGRVAQAALGLPPTGIDHFIAVTRRFDGVSAIGAVIPTLAAGLREFLSTGHDYGHQVGPLRRAPMVGLLEMLSPLLGRVMRNKPAPATGSEPSRFVMRSTRMNRDFEVFVSMPDRPAAARLPLLVVLDANLGFSIVAETAARLAAAGEIQEIVVAGIGTPRQEGPAAFGIRRLEEFSPPFVDYDMRDPIGLILRGMFAFTGADARRTMGQGDGFMHFITRELLPQLQRDLPIDPTDIGLLGHSAGGTFVGYALLQPQSPFRKYLAISPAVNISGSWLMRASLPDPVSPGTRAFLALGGDEKTNAFNIDAGIPRTGEFAARIGAIRGLDVKSVCFEGETHSTVLPLAAAAGLLALYPKSEETSRT